MSVPRRRRGVCRLWWLRTAQAEDCHLRSLLTHEELARRAEFAREPDRLRYTAGRILTRAVLAQHLGARPADIRIERICRFCGGPHGKPRVSDADSHFDFSLSHDGGLVVLAVSTNGLIGIDIEQRWPRSFPRGLAARVLHPAELRRSGREPGQGVLLAYWTRKESLTKATGEGIRAGFDRIEVSVPEAPPALLDWVGHEHRVAGTSMAELTLEGRYLTAISALGWEIDGLEVLDAAATLFEEKPQ